MNKGLMPCRNRLRVTMLCFVLTCCSIVSGKNMVKGYVFLDANRNGVMDKGEAGIAHIPVSNGEVVTETDANGRFRLPLEQGQSVFPILPADYTIDSRVPNSRFFYAVTVPKQDVNFALISKPVKTAFRLNAIGDVQVGNYQELDYATRTLWPELLLTDSAEVNLFLGDLVNNNISFYPDMLALMDRLPSQSWTLLGNHDRDKDSIAENQNRTYNKTFGADVYAFNEGQVHFIVLNNVHADGKRGYVARLSDRQLSFVRNELAFVPADRKIVLTMHIPLVGTSNADSLLALLQGRGEVLALTGHTHQVHRFFRKTQGMSLHELNAGAACGFWWVGEKDWDGVPAALMQGGTPRCYFVIDFQGADYRFRCKAIGQDASRQMTVWVTGIDTLDTHLRDMRKVEPGTVMMTVFGACDSTSVRFRIDGGAWVTCNRGKMVDANVARAREMNLTDVYPTKYNRINPLRSRNSSQLWVYTLPAEYRQGAHLIEVEATDRFGFSATGRRTFCFPR